MSSKKKIYRAVIVGAGRIASGFDTPSSQHVLTFAHALTKNSRVKLCGIMDINEVQGKKEARKWKTPFYADMNVMCDALKPDIVIIATPDATHLKILAQLLKKHPGIIICEKPVVSKQQDMEKAKILAEKNSVPIIVNFRRQFDETVADIRDRLSRGEYGSVLSANCLYTKGVLHNGTHMIDLARYFFGEMISASAHFRVNDFPLGAPSLGGVATFERCPQFYFMNGDERHFSVFEFEILTAKKRIRFTDEGLLCSMQDVVPDSLYKGYYVLGKPKIQKTKLWNALSRLTTHAVNVLDGKEKVISSLENTLKTEEACFRLLENYHR